MSVKAYQCEHCNHIAFFLKDAPADGAGIKPEHVVHSDGSAPYQTAGLDERCGNCSVPVIRILPSRVLDVKDLLPEHIPGNLNAHQIHRVTGIRPSIFEDSPVAAVSPADLNAPGQFATEAEKRPLQGGPADLEEASAKERAANADDKGEKRRQNDLADAAGDRADAYRSQVRESVSSEPLPPQAKPAAKR
jgi:hypothetical protein